MLTSLPPGPFFFSLIYSDIHRQISIVETFGCLVLILSHIPTFWLTILSLIPSNYQFLALMGCPSLQILFPNYSRTLFNFPLFMSRVSCAEPNSVMFPCVSQYTNPVWKKNTLLQYLTNIPK